MIHRRPRRMPGMVPCSNIAYTASRPTSSCRAISGTEIRLLRGHGCKSVGSLARSDLGIAVCSPVGGLSGKLLNFCLAFQADRSDESSCANQAQKKVGTTNMTNAETNTAATVAGQGAHVAPEKAPSKKGATQKKGAPKGKKAAKGGKAKAGKTATKPARAKEASAPRPESKGAKILDLIGRAKGATLA